MRKTIRIFLLLFFLPFGKLWATGDSLYYLLPSDTVYLEVSSFGEKIFHHILEPKQTLYSLAKFYGLTIDELYYYNPGLSPATVAVGDAIRIPIPNRSILRYQTYQYTPYSHVPVFYVVRKGDTLYRIAKYFFKMPAEEIMYRNGLEGIELKVGQRLHIGWMSIDGVPAEYRATSGPFGEKLREMRVQFTAQAETQKVREHRGVAAWNPDNTTETDLYALHRFAPKNSIIEITSPWMKQTIYARVIGDIPDKMHGEEVVAVISPTAARLLGAVDPRFHVQVRYYR